MSPVALRITEAAHTGSVLLIANGIIRVESPKPVPGWWRRFWYWALLDWRWQEWS